MKVKSYLYGVGRISVLETRLLSPSVFWSFLEQNWESIINQVRNVWFNQDVPKEFDFELFDRYFEKEKEITFGIVAELMADEIYVEILKYFYDFKKIPAYVGLIEHGFLLDYFKKKIDYKNLEIWFRGGKKYLEGGYYSPDFWLKSTNAGELRDLRDDLKKCAEKFEEFKGRREFYLFSVCRLNFEKKILKESQKFLADPSKLFYYYFLKVNEIFTVRFFIFSKFYGLPHEKLRKYLETYYG